ncbi:MAG: type III glutamate--ammonia ligase [Candidatus Dormibacterales bacterium]
MGTSDDNRVLAENRSEFEAKRDELKAAGIRYCLAGYTDVHGVGKAKAVPIEHFSGMMRGSELFTGAALDGLGQGPSDDELSIRPDLNRIVELPWMPGIAWAPGHLYYHHEPWPMCSRVVLQRAVDRAAALGFTFNLGIETEFYLVRKDGGRVVPANPKDVLSKAAYDIVDLIENFPFMDEVIGYMNHLGWDVHSFDHEDSNSQFEFDFSYTDVMSMADRQTLWRMMMKEVARKHGFEVTLMPKPYANRTGTGAHFNMSLADVKTGKNLFADPADPRGCGVSKLAYQFIAGVLAHAPAITAVAAPTVNSYKRLVKSGSMTGFTWAPIFRSYGGNNRTHMLRIPLTSPRLESRAVDATCNPYLAAAAYLQAGLDGVENNLDPGDPRRENMYMLSDAELEQRGVKTLPRTLLEAVEAFDADPIMERVFGPELKRAYFDLKTAEWWDYHNSISPWEIDRYLTFF